MKRRTLLAILVNVFGGSIFGYNCGIVGGLLDPLIRCTLFKEGEIKDLSLYKGLFTSIILCFAAIGSPLGVKLSNMKGMKLALLVMGIIGAVVPGLMIVMKNFYWIMCMRGLLGLAVGISSAICPMYSGALVSKEIRGRVGTVFQLSITLSIFLSQVMNFFFVKQTDPTVCVPLTDLQWRLQLAGGLIFGIGLIIVLPFAENLKPGQVLSDIEAESSLVKEHHNNDHEAHPTSTEPAPKDSIYNRKNAKWLILAIMLSVMNQMTGINTIMYYSPDIFKDSGVSNPLLYQMLCVGLWNALTVFIFMALVDKLSRNSLMSGSLVIMAIGSLLMLARFPSFGGVVPIMLVILGFELGPGPLFFVIISQDLPPALIDQGTSIANVLMWVFNVVIAFVSPFLISKMGASGTFVLLAVIQILCLMYYFFTFRTPKNAAAADEAKTA